MVNYDLLGREIGSGRRSQVLRGSKASGRPGVDSLSMPTLKGSDSMENSNPTWVHFMKCYFTMQELESVTPGLIPFEGGWSFLDIACAPGGFSQYLLSRYTPEACFAGYGISLSSSLGGFPILVRDLHNRFQACSFDLLSHPSRPLPAVPNMVALVIADAQYLPAALSSGTYASNSPTESGNEVTTGSDVYSATRMPAHHLGRLALLVSQMRIAVRTLQHGGTFIFRFVLWERTSVNVLRIFLLCFDLFESVTPFKSELHHSGDSTFYAVCRGFKRDVAELKGVQGHLDIAYSRLYFAPAESPLSDCKSGNFMDTQRDSLTGEFKVSSLNMRKSSAQGHVLELLYPRNVVSSSDPTVQKVIHLFDIVDRISSVCRNSYETKF